MSIDWSDAIAWFGRKPDFHDGEVLSVELRRSPQKSSIRVLAWNTGGTVDHRGYLTRERQVVVHLSLDGIVEQDLRGWNHQNVLLSLEEVETDSGSKIELQSSFGLEGTVAANSIVVEIEHPDDY
ncbi:hypothetical protein ASC97_23545 [Rhizobium sp. Root1203]|uniref:Imm50 family immunity protein n=1 Tax=Rhizobium sp. Root1203 TaxID=1736427 RepID=UPI00070A5B17|nr:Imm50 family immunity protein [Rhizobium sp. Root1203]KQV29313.1 hypothetical protein ASC97_23545 [Rhizobium sp. Root1203]